MRHIRVDCDLLGTAISFQAESREAAIAKLSESLEEI